MDFRRPKGTDDIMPPASQRWRRVLRLFDELAERYGYDLVITPYFESTELFARGVGEATEVVEKQMYTFDDKAGRSMTLRTRFCMRATPLPVPAPGVPRQRCLSTTTSLARAKMTGSVATSISMLPQLRRSPA